MPALDEEVSGKKLVSIVKDRLYFAILDNGAKHHSNTRVHYFCIDDEFEYESFYSDFGPLNLAILYKYCVKLKRKFKSFSLSRKRIVHYSCGNQQKVANAAYLIGAYAIIYLNKSADEVWKALDALQPPKFLPFRDASLGPSLYGLSLHAVLSGVEKAVKFKWLDFANFNVEEYQLYERVENGDFNWIIPEKILAFCGPHNRSAVENGYPYHAPESYFEYFRKHNVTTVVRLNKKLYDAKRFIEAGFQHVDMFFVDGSTPSDAIVKRFIETVDAAPGAVAVHCKAGLGRTGTLIACWMMKQFGLTAPECIAWIRICRPGSVIGPQQQFLLDKQAYCWTAGGHQPPQQNGSVCGLVSGVDDIQLADRSGSPLNEEVETAQLSPSEDTVTQGDRLLAIKSKKQKTHAPVSIIAQQRHNARASGSSTLTTPPAAKVVRTNPPADTSSPKMVTRRAVNSGKFSPPVSRRRIYSTTRSGVVFNGKAEKPGHGDVDRPNLRPRNPKRGSAPQTLGPPKSPVRRTM